MPHLLVLRIKGKFCDSISSHTKRLTKSSRYPTCLGIGAVHMYVSVYIHVSAVLCTCMYHKYSAHVHVCISSTVRMYVLAVQYTWVSSGRTPPPPPPNWLNQLKADSTPRTHWGRPWCTELSICIHVCIWTMIYSHTHTYTPIHPYIHMPAQQRSHDTNTTYQQFLQRILCLQVRDRQETPQALLLLPVRDSMLKI